jgi:hypothetical protein
MYILFGLYEDEVAPVAKFTTEKLAREYVDGVTLETFPNGSRRFRRDSLLSSYRSYQIEKEFPHTVPINPPIPNKPLSVDYILEVTGRDGKFSKINYGRYKEECDEEQEFFNRTGCVTKLVTRKV